MNTTPANEWREEFDRKLAHEHYDCAAHDEGQYCCLDPEHKRNAQIKTFIQNLLDTHSAHLVERIEGLRKELVDPYHENDTEDEAHNQALDQAIDIVKGGIR